MDLAMLAAQFMAWGVSAIKDWGYLGVFAVGFASSASILLPLPIFALVFTAGAVLNPVLVGIIAGVGAGLGEITGYALGFGGKQVIDKKHKKMFRRAEEWTEKHGFFAVVILFAATPLPDDILGIIGGAIGYDVKKFILASIIGKIILNTALAFAGFYGSAWLLGALGASG
jgi:membrane protein YqaA with SNARE-associated domain